MKKGATHSLKTYNKLRKKEKKKERKKGRRRVREKERKNGDHNHCFDRFIR